MYTSNELIFSKNNVKDTIGKSGETNFLRDVLAAAEICNFGGFPFSVFFAEHFSISGEGNAFFFNFFRAVFSYLASENTNFLKKLC